MENEHGNFVFFLIFRLFLVFDRFLSFISSFFYTTVAVKYKLKKTTPRTINKIFRNLSLISWKDPLFRQDVTGEKGKKELQGKIPNMIFDCRKEKRKASRGKTKEEK